MKNKSSGNAPLPWRILIMSTITGSCGSSDRSMFRMPARQMNSSEGRVVLRLVNVSIMPMKRSKGG